jgi:hypothetical protein
VQTFFEALAAGAGRRLRVPAELACDADPDAGGAGVAGGHLRRLHAARVHDQYADAVRHGAGDRHRGRRRHRRGRGGRAPHARGRPVAARRHDQGDGRGLRAGGGDRAHPGRGLRAGGLPRRHRRRDVPAVRDHGRRVDGAVGAGGADADAGAVRDDAQTEGPRREARAAGARLRGLQPFVRRRHGALRQRRRARHPRQPGVAGAAGGADLRRLRHHAEGARRLRAARGPGLLHRLAAAAGGGVDEPHARGQRRAAEDHRGRRRA